MKNILLILFLLLIIVTVFGLGFLGYIPVLSSILGADKPRNLGIKYSENDKTSGRNKSQIIYESLPDNTSAAESIQRSGSRSVKAEFSSAEITALMNNRPWRYWPYKDIQVKFNGDGSAEISGGLIKNNVPPYASAIGIPQEAVKFAMRFLPANPVFYVKMRAALENNQVTVFEPQAFSIGKLSLPVGIFLSFQNPKFIPNSYAQNPADMVSELSKVKNKRALIIDYINRRLSLIKGFFAKSAKFSDDKLIFDGTLAEKEATVR